MSIRRKITSALATAFVAIATIALLGGRNTAAAESAPCLGNSGNLCRTTAIQECLAWQWTTVGGSIGFTCARWFTVTNYYYFDYSGGGNPTKPGLK